MVDLRQDRAAPIPEVGFAAPGRMPVGLEVLSLAELRERGRRKTVLATLQRPTFHHLITLDRGSLRHTVDFTDYTLRPGSWLWVRPGQVQQWHDLRPAEGTLILFEPDFLDPATAEQAAPHDSHAPVLRTPSNESQSSLMLATEHLRHEFEAPSPLAPDVRTTALRHLLAVLVLRLSDLSGTAGSPPGEYPGIFLEFRDALEENFAGTRRVEDYAKLLGYSPRTLSRASIAAVGLGAKALIDRRIILEAKRLLAHSDLTAAQVASSLGFSDATNFSKFFHQRTGNSPLTFRTSVRGDPTP
ncbi:helix-turn-helix domain-containing protein [Paractinoplanes tereljensis]|nr:AraC family transcriptional regulator [Actinoplanes tereljensis]